MQLPKLSTLLCVLLLTALPQVALADGFAMFSKHDGLKGHVIIDAGDFDKIDAPVGKLGATELVKLNSNCFRPAGTLGLWGYGKKAGFVLVDRNKAIRVALIESSIASINIEAVAATQVACPTADSDGLPLDPQLRLQELIRQQELMKRELERLRLQQKK